MQFEKSITLATFSPLWWESIIWIGVSIFLLIQVPKYFKNIKEIEYVTELIERIKRTFKERITKNEWLSQETKEYALIKIDKMIQAIGYREKWDPDPDCEFIEYDAFGNNQKLI
jgi:predicted metalloendopeptidase